MSSRRLHWTTVGLHIAGFVLAFIVIGMAASGMHTSNEISAYAECKGIWGEDICNAVKEVSKMDLTTTSPASFPSSMGGLSGMSGRRLLVKLGGLTKLAKKGTGSDDTNYFNEYAPLVIGAATVGVFWNLLFGLVLLIPRFFDATVAKSDAKSAPWARWPFIQLFISAIWWILWLAAAACVSSCYELMNAKDLPQEVGVITGTAVMLWFGWLVWSGLIAVSAIGMHRNIKSARLQADAAAVTNKHTGVENPKHDNGPPPKTQFVKVGRNGHTNGSGVRFVQSDTARDQAAPMDIEHGTCQVGVYRGAAPNDGYGEVWRG